MGGAGGVELRETSIRIVFSYQGRQVKETLFLDNKPLAPTPANAKYAKRIATEVRAKINSGDFVYADYFPHSPRAVKSKPANVAMLHDVMDTWLKLLERKASTKRQYSTRINSFWKSNLANLPLADVKHSDILAALQAGTWTSAKSRNNELSMIKQMFEFARRDKLITENPCEGIERAKYQKPKPDPFTLDEANAILTHLQEHRPEPVWNFTQFQFFSGLRTSEAIGLRWQHVDFRKREVRVEGGNVYDEESDTTKTAVARSIKLTTPAFEALQRQRAHTFLQGEHVFHDPKTDAPWKYATITDVRSYWASTLKKLGIRYRRPYNTRHTFASLGLMSGANPAFLAKQLGHSQQMFFSVYADWIDGNDSARELAKIEASIGRFIPELTLKGA